MSAKAAALAALAATASFAQSSVTLSGNLDFAYSNSTGSNTAYNGVTVASTTGTSSTSVINIRAEEDLGGGMRATAHYGLDPRTLANDSFGVTNTTTAGSASAVPAPVGVGNTATGLGRDELFVGLSGGFGNIRLGSPNSLTLATHLDSSPLGTGIGSGYTTVSQPAGVTTRFSRSVRYDSPNINGITLSALYAPGADTAKTSSGAATENSAVGSNTTSFGEPNNRQATELSLAYNNGPLNLRATVLNVAAQTNSLGYYPSGTLANYAKVTNNQLAANYAIGNTTVYAGFTSGDAYSGSTGIGSTSTVRATRFGVKQAMGNVSVMLQSNTLVTTSNVGVDTTVTVVGARVDYALSKTAAAYIGYQRYDSGAVYNPATYGNGDLNTVSVGLRKSF